MSLLVSQTVFIPEFIFTLFSALQSYPLVKVEQSSFFYFKIQYFNTCTKLILFITLENYYIRKYKV